MFGISILWTIGIILILAGAVLTILGTTGRAIGGRKNLVLRCLVERRPARTRRNRPIGDDRVPTRCHWSTLPIGGDFALLLPGRPQPA